MQNEDRIDLKNWLKSQLNDCPDKKRVLLIIGPPDSGKSTLANAVASILDVPSQTNWLPNDFSLLKGKTLIIEGSQPVTSSAGAEHRLSQLIVDGHIEQQKLFSTSGNIALAFQDVNIIITATENTFTDEILARSVIIVLDEITEKERLSVAVVTQQLFISMIHQLCKPDELKPEASD